MGMEFHLEGSGGIVGAAAGSYVKNPPQLLTIADRVLLQRSFVMNLTQSKCLNSLLVIKQALRVHPCSLPALHCL